MTLSAGALQSALSAAVGAASSCGVAVNIAIVDAGGNLAGFLRMPGAFLASADIAIDKAWSANSFGMSTVALTQLFEEQSAMVRQGLLSRPRITVIPGGHPIHHDGTLKGGIGVSGASAEQDDEIALCGLKALMES